MIGFLKLEEVNFDLQLVRREAIQIVKAPDEILSECDEVRQIVNKVIRPESRIAYYSDMEVGTTSISLGGMQFKCGEKIAEAFLGATSAAVFVATLGEEVSGIYNRLQADDDYLKAYWLDMLANAAIDRTVDRIRGHVSERAAEEGLETTSNWGPGYCGWPLTDQRNLVGLIPESGRLVRLTDSMLMQPMKSIAGIIGIGKDVKYHVSNCADCILENCFYKNHCK